MQQAVSAQLMAPYAGQRSAPIVDQVAQLLKLMVTILAELLITVMLSDLMFKNAFYFIHVIFTLKTEKWSYDKADVIHVIQ
ncbi:hypothetical protein AB9W99_003987 [Providencia rettgeri]